MRSTKTLSISFPPAQLREMEEVAREENRTLSELLREAWRRYQYQRQLRQLNLEGRAQAARLGIAEDDVVSVIHEYRRENRRKSKPPTR